jgi:hypothetical protein
MRITLISNAIACAALATSAIAGMPMGTPILEIGGGTGTSFSQAIQNGLIRPWDPGTVSGIAQNFYDTQGTTAFVNSALTPDLDVMLGDVTHPGSLVMQWNPLMQGESLAVAAFDLDLTQAMGRTNGIDLRGGSVHFWVGAPAGVWDLSVELMDKNGNWRGWFRSMPPPDWSQQWINFDETDQDGWMFYEDPGFDLWSVVGIRFDEAGSTSTTFPAPPPGAQPDFWDWNAFNHITLIPSPGATSLSVLVAGMLAPRRRR